MFYIGFQKILVAGQENVYIVIQGIAQHGIIFWVAQVTKHVRCALAEGKIGFPVGCIDIVCLVRPLQVQFVMKFRIHVF